MTELLSAYQEFEGRLSAVSERDGYVSPLLMELVEVARVTYRSRQPEMGQVDPYYLFFSTGADELTKAEDLVEDPNQDAQVRTAMALASILRQDGAVLSEELTAALQEHAAQPIAPAD